MKPKHLPVVVFLLITFAGNAQFIYPSTINVTGKFGTSKDFQVEISIGESTSITTLSNSSVVVTSGVLQTSVAVQPAINAAAPLSDEIKLYPNPTRDYLGISFLSKNVGRVEYQLYNQLGKLLLGKQFFYFGITGTQTLNLQALPAGIYLLAIQQYSAITNEIIKKGSFKIIKVN